MTAGSKIPPHGGRLVDLFVPENEMESFKRRAADLKKIVLGPRELSDFEMLATGALSPLAGFMTSGDYNRVVEEMRLESGIPWTMPIVLPVSKDTFYSIEEGGGLALSGQDGGFLGMMTVEDRFIADRRKEARLVYGTEDTAHPGVAAVFAAGKYLVGGPVRAFRKPPHQDFPDFRLDPTRTRAVFAERGWKRIAGFQTRNPIHRAHEYILKCALEVMDGVFIHPIAGETKDDDIPVQVRMACYEKLIERYFPPDRALLSVNPASMRYAGPREAVFHAIVRKNYGCTHFIVGRDHAGVGNYYGPFDAQKIFGKFDPAELGITPLFFDNSFFCSRCAGMATPRTCPHPEEARFSLSGTRVREMLRSGEYPPSEFTRPEIAEVLVGWWLGREGR